MTKTNIISLKLFNAVQKTSIVGSPILLDKEGYYIPAEGAYAINEIKSHLSALKLSGDSLNNSSL